MMPADLASMSEYSWVPFYEELANRLTAYREPAGQRELITQLEQLRAAGMPITPLEDKDDAGNRALLEEIDPFTFIGTFNRGIGDDKRLRIAEAMRQFFEIKTAVPQGFAGVPVLHNVKSWFFGYRPDREPDDIAKLWAVFAAALAPDPLGTPAFGAAFDRALEVKNTNVNLTMGLFWVRPRVFASLDSIMRAQFGIKLPRNGLTYAFYRQELDKLRAASAASFPEMSRAAWTKAQSKSVGMTKSAIQPPNDIEYWMVGAYWDGSEPANQTNRFFDEGIWENGYEDRYLDQVKEMKPGDRIAIKASSTQRHDLPFDSQNKTVSRMAIKARGTIVRNRGDGRTVEVEWEPGMESKDWYFYTARPTVWHLRKDEEMAQKLIRFAFFDEPQDYTYFTERWWPRSKQAVKEITKDEAVEIVPPYSVADVIAEGVFLREEEITRALERLRTKKAIILQGAPGVGKTFVARKLAYAAIEARDDARVTTVQFHPSYSYEDFIRGYRPTGKAGAFTLQDGPFLKFCERAGHDPDRAYVIIVDEINRGHLSQVFGEVFMLLEADKRGPRHAVTPLYRQAEGERFFVPENVHVIGTMNVADRSLALVDFALRRRFAFITLEPQFASQSFASWLRNRKMSASLIDRIVQRMGALNIVIAEDSHLGPAFRIGHSFFCPRGDDFSTLDSAWFSNVVDTEIKPLLEEYWYDAHEKVASAVKDLGA